MKRRKEKKNTSVLPHIMFLLLFPPINCLFHSITAFPLPFYYSILIHPFFLLHFITFLLYFCILYFISHFFLFPLFCLFPSLSSVFPPPHLLFLSLCVPYYFLSILCLLSFPFSQVCLFLSLSFIFPPSLFLYGVCVFPRLFFL